MQKSKPPFFKIIKKDKKYNGEIFHKNLKKYKNFENRVKYKLATK
tara:strand:+ start:214 stop:348 length:135 start_codon:yes stop_codon:yes gene_type:complete